MSGRLRLVQMLSAVLVIGSFTLLLPEGFAYPTDENFMEATGPLFYPMSDAGRPHDTDMPTPNFMSKPKSCFHFYVTRNMSSLLAEATKMLQQVRTRHEREWIMTFIYRIKSLAEHLRTHPESRNYDCLSGEEEKMMFSDQLRFPQPELYFEDDMILNKRDQDTNQEAAPEEEALMKTTDNQDSHPPSSIKADSAKDSDESTSSTVQKGIVSSTQASDSGPVEADETSASDSGTDEASEPARDVSPSSRQSAEDGILLSSPPDCEANRACVRALNRQRALKKETATETLENDTIEQERQHQQNLEEEEHQQTVLKKRIRKALLEEMAPEVKKLRTVGGSEEDLINLWKQSEVDSGKTSDKPHYNDFDYEEIGAAAGDLSLNDRFTSDQTVAPSLDDMKNFGRQFRNEEGTKAYEPYDDSDVLVKQLFDVRYEQSPQKTTESAGEEYLITSTHSP